MESKRILAINGSHRGEGGHTRFLIDCIFRGAAAAGAGCEVVSLARHKINRCLACGQCRREDHYLRCAYEEKDDVAAIFEKMAGADLLIFGTPVYVLGMSGLMKTFLDRLYATGDSHDLRVTQSGLLFHHIDHEICSKPLVSLVCCDNLEAETPRNAVDYFRAYARFMDAPHVGELVRNGGLLCGYGRDPEKAARLPKIQAVYAAYEQAGLELATLGRIRPVTQRRANQEIITVPLFGLLKRLPPFKRVMVGKAREMIKT